MFPKTFQEVLDAPCFVLNLDRCVRRWEVSGERLRTAGFKPERMSSVDGRKIKNRHQVWVDFGARPDFVDTFDSDGQCCSTLTHASAWDHIVRNNIPYASIFEDDILFHKDWKDLAPKFYDQTDRTTDVLFFGSQGAGKPDQPMTTNPPVFCVHAYMVTLEGAKKLLHALRTAPKMYIVDCMTIDMMHRGRDCPFTWQCWNATMYPDPARHNVIECRNDGLVFQDEDFPSEIHTQSEEPMPAASPLVSVIIPTYNRFAYLLRAIRSVIAQTYPNIEIIVVDDASTDPLYKSENIQKEIALLKEQRPDLPIVVHRLPINMRQLHRKNGDDPVWYQGLTRNVGIEHATGEWIAFLDDDDYWIMPNKLELQMSVMKECGAGMCTTNMLDEKGVIINPPHPRVLSHSDFLRGNPACTSTVIVDALMLRNIGMFHRVEFEDWDCWRRITQKTDCIYLDICSTYYERNSTKHYLEPAPREDQVTFVTGYVNMNALEDRPNTKTLQDYLVYGATLMNSGAKIVMFCDDSAIDEVRALIDPINLPNVHIVPFRAPEELVYNTPRFMSANLPRAANGSTKDTNLYMAVQLQKVHWVKQASELNPFGSTNYMWIDFGIFHVTCKASIDEAKFHALLKRRMCMPADVQNRILVGSQFKDGRTHLTIGESTAKFLEYFSINTMGGVLCATRELAEWMAKAQDDMVEEIIRDHNIVIWESSIWTLLRARYPERFYVYYGEQFSKVFPLYPTIK